MSHSKYLKIAYDPEFEFYDEVHKLKTYHEQSINVIRVIEDSDLSDVREKLEFGDISIPKRPKFSLKKLIELSTKSTSCDVSKKLHKRLCGLLVENLDLKNSDNLLGQLPDKKDTQAVFTFLTKFKDIFKKQQAKLFYLNAVCGLYLELYFRDFKKRESDESWGTHIKSNFSISESYARNLRSVGKLVNNYPKLQKLSLTFKEFMKLKKNLLEMLEVDEYANFWKTKE